MIHASLTLDASAAYNKQVSSDFTGCEGSLQRRRNDDVRNLPMAQQQDMARAFNSYATIEYASMRCDSDRVEAS